MINEEKSVSNIIEEEEMATMQDFYYVIKMFPEEENDEDFRSAVKSQKYIKIVLASTD